MSASGSRSTSGVQTSRPGWRNAVKAAISPRTADVAAVQKSVNVSSMTSRPIAGPLSTCASASSSSADLARRSTPDSSGMADTSRTAASTAADAAWVAGRSMSGESTNAHGWRGEGRVRSAMSGSSASSTRTDRSTSAGALATNGMGTGRADTSGSDESSAVRAVYRDSPTALSWCSRSA
jgi:hypothetical protein